MAITFVLLKEIPNKELFKPRKRIYKTANTWTEIESLIKQDFSPISKNFFNMIRTLELTKEFRDGILKLRKQHNIPIGGFSIKQTIKNVPPHLCNIKTRGMHMPPKNNTFDYDIPYSTHDGYEAHIDLAQQRIPIIYGNCIMAPFFFPEEPVVSLEQNITLHRTCDYIQIEIHRNNSAEDIIKYFKRNAGRFQTLSRALPPKNDFKVSDKDFRIYELRKQDGKPYAEIAETIVKEFNLENSDEHINDNSVLQAYKRTERIIYNSLLPLNLT